MASWTQCVPPHVRARQGSALTPVPQPRADWQLGRKSLPACRSASSASTAPSSVPTRARPRGASNATAAEHAALSACNAASAPAFARTRQRATFVHLSGHRPP